MKTLLLLRHAKSSWKDTGIPDHERPLNKRGERDAPRMGELLFEQDLVPDQILSSTARRARLTAQAVAESCGYEGEIELLDSLYMADPEDYLEALRALPDEIQSAMVVGHNPGIEEFLADLTGAQEAMPTAALAQINLPLTSWGQLRLEEQAELVRIWLPREIT